MEKGIKTKRDKIKVISWTFPTNDEEIMKIVIDLNGYIFEGIVKERVRE